MLRCGSGGRAESVAAASALTTAQGPRAPGELPRLGLASRRAVSPSAGAGIWQRELHAAMKQNGAREFIQVCSHGPREGRSGVVGPLPGDWIRLRERARAVLNRVRRGVASLDLAVGGAAAAFIAFIGSSAGAACGVGTSDFTGGRLRLAGNAAGLLALHASMCQTKKIGRSLQNTLWHCGETAVRGSWHGIQRFRFRC